MSGAGVRVGVGARFVIDEERVEVVELVATQAGNEVVLRDSHGGVRRIALRELLFSQRVQLLVDEPGPDAGDDQDVASVLLDQLSCEEREAVRERAAHLREVLTGYRSGSDELACEGEPREQYAPGTGLEERYAAKAAELGVGLRTLKRWVAQFRDLGEAGLAPKRAASSEMGRVDERWVQTALAVMVEHEGASKPSRKMVIERTDARVAAEHGPGGVTPPSRATAYRVLEELERRQPTFRLSAKRNLDIAGRPGGTYGKLRPTRPGEYLLMDTTRLDVFALDPVTLRWLQAELSVGMDWYTRCVTGIRVTPVSTKAVDISAVLFQAFRPRPAPSHWPRHAVWPEHGIPHAVLVDRDALEGPMAVAASGPAIVPETLVVDHGKVYVSDHLTSVCRRMGISVQPARLRTGRDKGPVERFFRTLREDLLQALPAYKGPDIHSRGVDVESQAFFFIHELEAIIREWVATVYHHRPHTSLVDPRIPGLRMSPAAMFEHGMSRAGYIEAPRDPDLAFEFLDTEWRTIQHYGVEVGGRRYNGPGLDGYRKITSPYRGPVRGKWPIHLHPDDIGRAYFRDPADRSWHTLAWEHAPVGDMPLSEDALAFARRLAAKKYRFPNDRLAVADLLERWNLGLDKSPAERRIALRVSREQAPLDLPLTQPPVSGLPSVRRALEGAPAEPESGPEPLIEGDDDAEDQADLTDEDFYADALEDV